MNKKIVLLLTLAIILFYLFKTTTFFTEPVETNNSVTTPDSFSNPPLLLDKKVTPENSNNAPSLTEASETAQAQEYIVSCPEFDFSESEEQRAETERKFDEFNQYLKASEKPMEKLAYYLFENEKDTGVAFDKLYQFNQENPNNKLAYDQLLKLCFNENNIDKCDDDLFNRAQLADKENGTFWLNIAALKLKKNDIDGVFDALHEIEKAANMDEYFFELADFYEQTSRDILDLSYKQRLVAGIGYAAAKPWFISEIMSWCHDNNTNDQQVAQACLTLGTNLEQKSKQLLSKSLGIALQKNYFEAKDNQQALAELEKKLKKIERRFQDKQFEKIDRLIMHDDDLAKLWISSALTYGEENGIKYVVEEAIWRSRDPNYNPCPILPE
ncbi:hypothetical protein AAD001_10555 [Colwelliaceae bacterium 6471]